MAQRFMVGRQPVFDDELRVFGYELLFRGPRDADSTGEAMTADVLVRAGLDLGLKTLVGAKLAFVNATRPFLVGEREVLLPPSQTVVEVLEDIAHDPHVIDGCRRLAGEGYTLALDDYVWVEGDEEMLALVDIVKLDVLAIPTTELDFQVERCASRGAQLLAEKVESPEQFERCRELGFDLFQGYLLSRPEVVEGRTLGPSRAHCLQILDKLSDPEAAPSDIERIVETDAGLSQRFLRAAGAGAARGFRREVSSIREGVVLVGEERLRSWVTLMMLSDSAPPSAEALSIAMCRARMCELLVALIAPAKQHSGFTVGLVSALDALLGAPLPDIVAHLSLADELVAALLAHEGTLGRVLVDVFDWETGGAKLEPRSGVDLATVESCYLRALAWANQVAETLDEAP